jgi:hypothetical protein
MVVNRKPKHRRLTILLILVLLASFIPTFVMADSPNEVGWMEADRLHDLGYNGEDVTVAIVDSGAIKHDLYDSNTLVAYYEVYNNSGVLDIRAAEEPAVPPPGWESLWDHQ